MRVLVLETSANSKSAKELKDALTSIKSEVDGVLTQTYRNLESSKENLQATRTSLEQIEKISKAVKRTYSIETGGKSFTLISPRVVSESSIHFDITVIGEDPLRDLVVSLGRLAYTGTPYGLSMIPQWQRHYELVSKYRKFEPEFSTPNFDVPIDGLMVWILSQGLNGRTDQIVRVKRFGKTLSWRSVVIRVAKWDPYAMKYVILNSTCSSNLPEDERKRPLLPLSASDFRDAPRFMPQPSTDSGLKR